MSDDVLTVTEPATGLVSVQTFPKCPWVISNFLMMKCVICHYTITLKMGAARFYRMLMSLYELLLVAFKMEGDTAKCKVLHKGVLELVLKGFQYVKHKVQKVDGVSC
jgi:hypothetical protein